MADWHLRLANFRATTDLVGEAVTERASRKMSELEEAGLIQRFEVAWEAGWKALRDFLQAAGDPVAVPVPVNVIRAGFEACLIEDGDAWIAMMRARNRMSHEYDRGAFVRTVDEIVTRFYPMLRTLVERLEAEHAKGN